MPSPKPKTGLAKYCRDPIRKGKDYDRGWCGEALGNWNFGYESFQCMGPVLRRELTEQNPGRGSLYPHGALGGIICHEQGYWPIRISVRDVSVLTEYATVRMTLVVSKSGMGSCTLGLCPLEKYCGEGVAHRLNLPMDLSVIRIHAKCSLHNAMFPRHPIQARDPLQC